MAKTQTPIETGDLVYGPAGGTFLVQDTAADIILIQDVYSGSRAWVFAMHFRKFTAKNRARLGF